MPQITKQSVASPKKPLPSHIDKKLFAKLRTIGDLEQRLKVLVYGISGTGKTTFWSSFPGKIFAIVRSGLKQPGEMLSLDTPELRKKITLFYLDEIAEFKGAIDIAAADDSYSTVVVDHASGVQDLALQEVLGLTELPAQKSWGLATRQEWGQCISMTKECLRATLNLEKDVVIVAQERDFETEDNPVDPDSELLVPHIGAGLSPSLVEWLNPACDYIVQTLIRQKYETFTQKIAGKDQSLRRKVPDEFEYCLRTGINSVYTTKFRKPKGRELPDIIVDPDYDKFLKLVRG